MLAQRRRSAITLACVDLDNFKALNDGRLSAAEAVAAADALMYAVKRKGKGGVAFDVVGGVVPTQPISETDAAHSA